MKSVFAKITFIDENGRPVDPGFGGGRPGGADPDYGFDTHPHPGHGLPGGGHPSTGPIYGGGHPGHGLPVAPVHPGHRLPWAPVTVWPPEVTDPDWGVGAPIPDRPDQPIYIPIDPAHPGNALPPVHGHPAPPIASTPPGTIWPPLPPDTKPPTGKAALLVWLIGVGWRYVVVDIPPVQPSIPGAAPK